MARMTKKKIKKYTKVMTITSIVTLFFLVLGITYAIFRITVTAEKTNVISVGTLDVRIENEQDAITLKNTLPLTNEEGLDLTPYTFDVVNRGTIDAEYDLYLNINEENTTLPLNTIKYYITKETTDHQEVPIMESPQYITNMIDEEIDRQTLYRLDYDDINIEQSYSYEMYLWLDENASDEVLNKRFEASIEVIATQPLDYARMIKKVDVSEDNNQSIYAYLYDDGTLKIEGAGRITSNIASSITAGTNISIRNIALSNGILNIPAGLFQGNTNIKSVTIPNTVTEIAANAFANCKEITGTITVPDSVVTIGKGAFQYCQKVQHIILPSSITRIENDTFFQCHNLEEMVIPENVTYIGGNAFTRCYQIQTLHIPSKVQTIGNWAFDFMSKLESFDVDPDNQYFIDADGILFTKDMTKLVRMPVNKVLDSYTIPSSVKTLSVSAFRSCASIKTIVIPSPNITLQNDVFYNIPNTVTIEINATSDYIATHWPSNWKNGCSANIVYLQDES